MLTGKDLEEQNKRLYCDSPPEIITTPPKDVPMVKLSENFYDVTKGERYVPDSDRSISGCAKDNWFWIAIVIAGTILITFISNNEIGWIPKEVMAEFTGGGMLYFLFGIVHIAPVVMLFFGLWGMKIYCDPSACNREHFTLIFSMILIVIGILVAYFLIESYQDNGMQEFWELKERMVGYALEDMA